MRFHPQYWSMTGRVELPELTPTARAQVHATEPWACWANGDEATVALKFVIFGKLACWTVVDSSGLVQCFYTEAAARHAVARVLSFSQ